MLAYGDIIFYTYPGQSVPHHVVIYLGGDRILQAPETGQDDRLARNRLDDAMIHYELRQAGVMLVSATENIDETPSGMLVHGIMSSIAEFYSLNLATEVTKGLVQKAAAGGTRPEPRSAT